MKTAIYIEDGTVQLVLTPDTEFEKNALSGFQDRPLEVKLFSGTFYDSRGGWIRQTNYYPNSFTTEHNSLILRIDTKEEEEQNAPHT